MGVDSVKSWLGAMRSNPGKLNFASTGNGSISHLGVELIKLKTQSFAVHVPNSSSGAAVTAILQGDVQFGCLPAVAVMPRSQLLPDLPTLRESGLPDVQAFPWFSYMAPKGTPRAIVERMNREIVAVLQDPEVRKRLQSSYFDPIGSTAESLAAFMTAERARWKPVIERAGIKPD
jgi:tripartite-type tricarboxylate transporter receptor subunit TctC